MENKEEIIRKSILDACNKLVENKLIARTWGNISARLSEDEFIITPSGLAYSSLNTSSLVKVKTADLSYEGDIKPSSEKGIHAEIYKLKKDVNFIIHTHQDYATALSIEDKGAELAPIVKYGLPGTKKLKKNFVSSLLVNKQCCSFLLQRHGVVCFGGNEVDTFNKVYDLEEKAKKFYEKNFITKPQKELNKPYLDDYAQMFGFSSSPVEEDRLAVELIKNKNALAAAYASKAKPMKCFDVLLQHFVYKKKYSKLQNKK